MTRSTSLDGKDVAMRSRTCSALLLLLLLSACATMDPSPGELEDPSPRLAMHTMTQQTTLHLITYAPALVGKDGRTVDVIHGMEKALPGLRLKWRLSAGGRPIPLPQRDAWLLDNIEDGGFPIVCNGDKSYPVTVSGMEKSGLFTAGGQPQFEVHAEMPLDEPVIAAAAAVLEAVAEGARAFWGRATPDAAAVDIAYQTAPTLQGPPSPRRGLPALKLSQHIRSPEIP